MLTVQQAAGTQFHSLLSVHSVLIQGELYPIMRKKKMVYFTDEILTVSTFSDGTNNI